MLNVYLKYIRYIQKMNNVYGQSRHKKYFAKNGNHVLKKMIIMYIEYVYYLYKKG